MTSLRGRRRQRARRPGERRRYRFTLGAGALAALAVLIGACTISSESPDAASLSGRFGPSSGTTTTSAAGGGAATPDESTDQARQAGDGDAATGGTAGDGPAAADTATTPDDGAGAGPDVAGTSGENEREQPVDAGEQAVGTAGEPTGAETGTAGETAAAPPATGAAAETADGVPSDTAPAPDPTGTPTGAESAFDERSKVSTVGIGSVYFGMSPEEAAERVGTSWAGIPTGGADCYVVTPTSGPPGVALWVYHGTMERVDIDTTLLRTQSGLGVGTHVGELQSRLGEKLVVEDHPFLAGWTLATFVPTDPNDAAFRIAFDISGGEVIRFRAGRTEIVALESCA